MLAAFYSSVFTREPSGPIPEPKQQETSAAIHTTIFSEARIKKKLTTLNTLKSPGPDNLHSRVLKEVAQSIAKPIQQLFSLTMNKGSLPLIWKRANVSPIFKKGKKQLASNYHPVSLTCIWCKVKESIIRDYIIAHMNANGLISKRQFGFLSGRLTILQLLHVMDEWTNILDAGGTIDVCYMDFMKAFDNVPHRLLIIKLHNNCIQGKLLDWIRSFLEHRQQRVVINGQYSTWSNVTSCIPQGSVLGPLLFVIYKNDLPDTVLSQVFLFADDTKMYRQIQDASDRLTFQEDISKLQEWADKWLLKCHPDKCKLMTIGRDPPPHWILYNVFWGQRIDTNGQCAKWERRRRHNWSQHDIQRRHQLPCNQCQQHHGDHQENIHLPWYWIVPLDKSRPSKEWATRNDCGDYAYQHCVIGGWGVTWLKPTSYCTMYMTLPCQTRYPQWRALLHMATSLSYLRTEPELISKPTHLPTVL